LPVQSTPAKLSMRGSYEDLLVETNSVSCQIFILISSCAHWKRFPFLVSFKGAENPRSDAWLAKLARYKLWLAFEWFDPGNKLCYLVGTLEHSNRTLRHVRKVGFIVVVAAVSCMFGHIL
jgi:hypothetical protein